MVLEQLFDGDTSLVCLPVYPHDRPMQEPFSRIGASNLGLTAPRKQDGGEVASAMWAIAETEWRRKNHGFVTSHQAYVESKSEHAAEALVEV